MVNQFTDELTQVGRVVLAGGSISKEDLGAIILALAARLERMEARIDGLELGLRTIYTGPKTAPAESI